MIKIEITDIENISNQDLTDLANYLIQIANNRDNDIPLQYKDAAVIFNKTEDHSVFAPPEAHSVPAPPEAHSVFAPPEAHSVFAPPEISKPSVSLDSQGLPWDFRIHARTKTKNKDGSWKRLRSVSNKTIDRVESELKVVQQIPPIIIVPSPTQDIPAPANDFAAIMTMITTAMTNKTLVRPDIMKVLNSYGIPSIPIIATRPDLIPAIMLSLQELIDESL